MRVARRQSVPGLRDRPGQRGSTMYFSYFQDLDGNKLCAFGVG
jgi:hypothetical protein